MNEWILVLEDEMQRSPRVSVYDLTEPFAYSRYVIFQFISWTFFEHDGKTYGADRGALQYFDILRRPKKERTGF